MRTRCDFSADGAAWSCQRCGRRVAKSKDSPPIATCSGVATRTIALCRFEKPDGNTYRCQVCGLEAAVSDEHSTPTAICGKPDTLRIINTPRHRGGAGTELKSLLGKIGIHASPGCKCTQRAAIMDLRGIAWCEANVTTIVGWLREEANKRGLPFIEAAGRLLVKRAIKNAKQAASSHE